MALAEDLTLSTEADPRDDIDDAVGLGVDVLHTLPVEEAVTRTGRYQNMLLALEAELFARNRASGASSGTTLFLWQNLQDFVAGKHNASFASGQLVPQAILSRCMCGGTVAGVVFDTNREVLWAGREQRLSNPK